MKKKILVLGSGGLIGHKVFIFLKNLKQYDIYDISNSRKISDNTILLDARSQDLLYQKIKEINPDFIINCIGVLIKRSEQNPKDAIYLNAYLPHLIKEISNEIGAKIIHISTDCVFSGSKKSPYEEGDHKDGEDIYSKTKGLGEINDDYHLTLRTSVVGPELAPGGEELFHWFMNQKVLIDGYTKSFWSGVTTIELARAVHQGIVLNITGLHHVTNNQKINKYELLSLFKKYTKKSIEIRKIDGRTTDKSFVDTRAALKNNIPSYEDMIFEMVEDIKENKELYSHYLKEDMQV
tara:strand:+ start:1418 stop:2296 length:879 start_codon:yes stop_codon:yes gene_type:complete